MLRPDQVPTREYQEQQAWETFATHVYNSLLTNGACGEVVFVPQSRSLFLTAEMELDVLDKYREHWDITEGAGGWKFAPKTDLCPAK